MTAQFRARIAAVGVPAVEIRGGSEERLRQAVERVEKLLAGWTLG